MDGFLLYHGNKNKRAMMLSYVTRTWGADMDKYSCARLVNLSKFSTRIRYVNKLK